MILNSIFKDAVTVSKDETFDGCQFLYQDTTAAKPKASKAYGLTINGDANVTVKNSKFANRGYSAIYMNSTGTINIENNHFDCTQVYNPIEGGSGSNTAKLTNVKITGNTLEGICGNNYMNFYNMEDGAKIDIEDNTVYGMSQQAEVIRISNLANNSAEFTVKNMNYSYDMSTEFDANWTKMFLFQDYTNGAIQDFSKITVNVEGTVCNGKEVASESDFPVGGLVCVYDQYKSADSTTQYPTDVNQPAITLK